MPPTPASSSVLAFRPAPLVPSAAGRITVPKPETVRDRLDSWKEIAGHLRRTVRTVQRWERLFGLPVHRHGHARGSSVYAYASELDRWWTERGAAQAVEDEGASGTSVLWEHVQCIDGVNVRLQVRLRMVGSLAAADVQNRALEQALAAAGESMVTQVQRRLAGLPE